MDIPAAPVQRHVEVLNEERDKVAGRTPTATLLSGLRKYLDLSRNRNPDLRFFRRVHAARGYWQFLGAGTARFFSPLTDL